MAEKDKHIGAYPDYKPHILLAYAFRPFFIILPFYLMLLIVLWGLVFAGVISLPVENLFIWHIYELLFGIGAAAVGAFILTALPEFFLGVMPVVGRRLLYLLGLWAVARVSFWGMSLWGIVPAFLLNSLFFLVIIAVATRPILTDIHRSHYGLYFAILLIALLHTIFFFSLMGLNSYDPIAVLKLIISAFMVLELVAFRRIIIGVANMVLEKFTSDKFVAKPFRTNMAVFAILLFGLVEFLAPSAVLGWLGIAIFFFTIGIFNDYFLEDFSIFKDPIIFYLSAILLFVAFGYGSIGVAYLSDQTHLIEHLRHLLTAGVLGISIYSVMLVVGFVHTGRDIATTFAMGVGFAMIVVAVLLRVFVPMMESYTAWIHLISGILWAFPFLWYLVWFGKILNSPRADGLPG